MRMPRQSSRGGGLLGGRFKLLLIAALGLAVYWFSNRTEVPFTGRQQFNTMSIQDSVKLGAQSYQQILGNELQQGNEVFCTPNTSCDTGAREVTESVREICARLE